MKFENQRFEDATIELDYNEFFGCQFYKCTIVIRGYGAMTLVNCFFDTCMFAYDGPARNTLGYLSMMHQAGGEMQKLIEGTIGDIRNGTYAGKNAV
ncbi:MAG: hypothetical protein AAFX41_03080 [Bacteroidota bacterium]